jgi:hypothetical protein
MANVVKIAADRRSSTWTHTLGDGLASQRIADDLVARFKSGNWSGHKPNPNLRPIERNYGFGLGDLGKP